MSSSDSFRLKTYLIPKKPALRRSPGEPANFQPFGIAEGLFINYFTEKEGFSEPLPNIKKKYVKLFSPYTLINIDTVKLK